MVIYLTRSEGVPREMYYVSLQRLRAGGPHGPTLLGQPWPTTERKYVDGHLWLAGLGLCRVVPLAQRSAATGARADETE